MPVPPTPPVLPPTPSSDRLFARFSYSSWCHRFPQRNLIPAVVIPLEQQFLDYLAEDGMRMPAECDDGMQLESQLSDSESDDDGTADGDEDNGSPPPSFPELIAKVASAIAELSLSPYPSSISGVFPKLNFSAPQDAAFLLPQGDGALRCKTPGDVVMLLKGSGAVGWDLAAFLSDVGHGASSEGHGEGKLEALRTRLGSLDIGAGGVGPASAEGRRMELVLKRWTALDPAAEFRAFVRDGRLLGICPRTTQFHDSVLADDVQRSIVRRISSFFAELVRPNFNEDVYTFDVHLSSMIGAASRSTFPEPKLTLLDINPSGPPTSPLLFSWDELFQLFLSLDTAPVLKLVESEEEAESLTPRGGKWSVEKVPYELVDYAKGTDVATLAQKWNTAMMHATRDD